MRASQLIEKLRTKVLIHGDVEIKIGDNDIRDVKVYGKEPYYYAKVLVVEKE